MSKKVKKKKGTKNKGIIIICSSIVLVIALMVGLYFIGLSSVSKKQKEVRFKVTAGESKVTVIKNLKNANLIKSEFSTFIYVFFNRTNLQAGEYSLDRSMPAKDIIKKIEAGKIVDDRKVITLKFVEGKRLKEYATYISENTKYELDDILATLSDPEFLQTLIDKYWFITEDILNKELFYPLEGYIFPSTYDFFEDASIETIITKMLDEMDKMLTPYKEKMEELNLTPHQVLSMASIIEKEAMNKEDREKVSQVIYTRLDKKMSLGMDVTTYYAVQKSLKDPLTYVDLGSDSPYNTRNSNVIGLPVGAICSPSKESLDAVFNPADTDYIYFYADITTGKVYFASTYQEFLNFKTQIGG